MASGLFVSNKGWLSSSFKDNNEVTNEIEAACVDGILILIFWSEWPVAVCRFPFRNGIRTLSS